MSNVDNLDGLADILGCRVSSLPLKYLVFRWGLSMRPTLFGAVLFKR
jgi:hypothetical protein